MTGKDSYGQNRGKRGSSRPPLSAPPFATRHGPAPLAVPHAHEPSYASSTASVVASSTNKKPRVELHVVGNSILPPHQTTAILRSISLIEYDGTSWIKVSDGTKKLYYQEFQKRCKWDPAVKDRIDALYSEKAASCYRDMIHDWLHNWLSYKEKPKCVSNDTWNNFLDHLNDGELQNDAELGSKIRPSEPCGVAAGSPVHQGESVSVGNIARGKAARRSQPVPQQETATEMEAWIKADLQKRFDKLASYLGLPSNFWETGGAEAGTNASGGAGGADDDADADVTVLNL